MLWTRRFITVPATLEVLLDLLGLFFLLTPDPEAKRTALVVVLAATALGNLAELAGSFLPFVPFPTERRRRLAISGSTIGLCLALAGLAVLIVVNIGFAATVAIVATLLVIALIADITVLAVVIR